MKKILITGKNGYLGTEFARWTSKYPDKYEINFVSVRGDKWKSVNFAEYDVVLHLAGIAHADTGKLSEGEQEKYYQINRDLTVNIAKKYQYDRNDKIGHFIYMSSIIVFDDKTNVNEQNIITEETIPNPSSFYGDSKYQAEKELDKLKNNKFILSIVRPPMIYGQNSKGNYKQLRKIAVVSPLFPNFKNERSMIFVDNLSLFLCEIIDKRVAGFFHPQNNDYVSTSDLVKAIAKSNGKKIYLTRSFNWLIFLLSKIPGKTSDLTNKAFGSLVYSKSLDTETIKTEDFISFEKSIKLTEKVIEE